MNCCIVIVLITFVILFQPSTNTIASKIIPSLVRVYYSVIADCFEYQKYIAAISGVNFSVILVKWFALSTHMRCPLLVYRKKPEVQITLNSQFRFCKNHTPLFFTVTKMPTKLPTYLLIITI